MEYIADYYTMDCKLVSIKIAASSKTQATKFAKQEAKNKGLRFLDIIVIPK